MSSSECPDAVFPSSNSEGVADLLPNLQGDFFDAPMVWGSVRRDSDFRGRCIMFYTDDYRFTAVWDKPDRVWKTGAPSFVEVNFSTSNALPRWRILQLIGQKRYLSRYWQERGMLCWVDLNVSPRWWNENLLGVPLGWLEGYLGAKVDDLTPKTHLQSYYDSDFDAFLTILKQNRKKLAVDPTRREPGETLRAEFESSVAKLSPLRGRIKQTEQLIDQIVYQLYGLTEDEIKIVEAQ